MRASRWLIPCATALLAGTALSCASAMRVYVNPEADLAFYRKVAVLPFADMSASSLAGPRVTRAFVTELIMTNRYQIMQPEEFGVALARQRVLPGANGAYDPDALRGAASGMGLHGILRGTISEYQVTRSGSGEVPVIAFDAELVDVGTGNVVWRSSISRRGKGRVPIFGGSARSLGRLTQVACQEMVARLRGGALR
jgi:hypothetical protein